MPDPIAYDPPAGMIPEEQGPVIMPMGQPSPVYRPFPTEPRLVGEAFSAPVAPTMPNIAEEYRQQVNAMKFKTAQQALEAATAYQRLRLYERARGMGKSDAEALASTVPLAPPQAAARLFEATRPVPDIRMGQFPDMPPFIQSGRYGERVTFAPQSYSIEATPGEGVKIIRGKPPISPNQPTTAFTTKLQEQLHSHDDAMSLLSHIEQNMDKTDFGVRGVAKDVWAKIGGQLGSKIDPEALDVRKSLKLLRSSLYKSLRSDSNIAEAERKQIENMLPSEGMVESLPDAVAALKAVRLRLLNNTLSASKRLGVDPPAWANQTSIPSWQNSPQAARIRADFKAGKLSEADAAKALSDIINNP